MTRAFIANRDNKFWVYVLTQLDGMDVAINLGWYESFVDAAAVRDRYLGEILN